MCVIILRTEVAAVKLWQQRLLFALPMLGAAAYLLIISYT